VDENPGANFAEDRGLLIHRDLDPPPHESIRGGKAANSAADNGDANALTRYHSFPPTVR
jgi:hypothetical protein